MPRANLNRKTKQFLGANGDWENIFLDSADHTHTHTSLIHQRYLDRLFGGAGGVRVVFATYIAITRCIW